MVSLHTNATTHSGEDRCALHGLSLPRSVLNALHKRAINCQPGVSLEHQHLAKRYVLRGVESGGAVSDIGRACAFVAPDGSRLPWLQRIDSIGVNGRHAIYLAETLVRLEILRVGRTCELVVTSHALLSLAGRTRPVIQSTTILRGRDGTLSVDLWKQEHQALRGNLAPVFYSRSGEILNLPEPFEPAIKKVTACVCCIGCKHSHSGMAPAATGERS
jgi:hypothetical protein